MALAQRLFSAKCATLQCYYVNFEKAEAMGLETTLRTVTCGELTSANAGQQVTLTGWVNRRRDHGKLIFLDLRDRYGVTQIIFDPERGDGASEAHAIAELVRLEYVLRVQGT